MTISTAVTVKIGDLEVPGVQAPVDFTDRTMGLSTELAADIGEIGAAQCRITLDNTDGALTPGGGSTYSSWDWHSKAIFIDATVGAHTATIFHGLLTDFELDDDGVNSFVTIRGNDFMTVGGRAVQTQQAEYGFSVLVGDAITFTFDRTLVDFGSGPVLDFSGVPMPQWGLQYKFTFVKEYPLRTDADTGADPYVTGDERVASDWLQTAVMPFGPAVAWPTRIYASGPTFPVPQYTTARYEFYSMSHSLVTETRYTYKFAENTASGELPFRNLQRGWTVDELITKAKITGVAAKFTGSSTHTAEVTNTDAESLYGERAITYTDIMLSDGLAVEGGADGQAQRIAERYANARSRSEFVVQQLQVTSKMCDAAVGASSASEQAWAELLDTFSGMWQVATVEFTPAGTATTITEPVIIWGRRIDATPDDVRVTLSFYPIQYTCAFLLDDPILGVLGGTLDTYDDATFTYDAGLLRYNGRPEYGMTLG